MKTHTRSHARPYSSVLYINLACMKKKRKSQYRKKSEGKNHHYKSTRRLGAGGWGLGAGGWGLGAGGAAAADLPVHKKKEIEEGLQKKEEKDEKEKEN